MIMSAFDSIVIEGASSLSAEDLALLEAISREGHSILAMEHQDCVTMQCTLQAITGSDLYAKTIMSLCNEISTHFVEPNSETRKECFGIAYNLACSGVSPDVIIDKLKEFDLRRIELLTAWNAGLSAIIRGSFDAFAFEMLTIANKCEEDLAPLEAGSNWYSDLCWDTWQEFAPSLSTYNTTSYFPKWKKKKNKHNHVKR